MGQIQAFYDQLEPLWSRLEVDKDQQDLFMEMNHGCSEVVLKAVSGKRDMWSIVVLIGQYAAELERCLELRRTSLSSFVLAARNEIELLWQELMLSEDEMGDFGEFIDGELRWSCLNIAANFEMTIPKSFYKRTRMKRND